MYRTLSILYLLLLHIGIAYLYYMVISDDHCSVSTALD